MKDVYRTPECACLKCGYRMNAAGSIDGSTIDPPEPGDVTLCLRCGAVMKFADDLTLRGMTEEEMDEISHDAEYMNFLARQVRKIHMIRKLN